MAAHIEGKGCSILDMTGLAQKGGAVFSHVRLAQRPEDIHAVRLAAGGARLLLGCDIIVAATFDGLAKIAQGETRAVINTHEAVTGDFTRNPDLEFPLETLKTMISDATGPGATDFVDATRLATSLLGDSIATNLFMLGFAYQKGLIPVSGAAIERAIELNGVAVEPNKRAFLLGRRAAHDHAAVERLAIESRRRASRSPSPARCRDRRQAQRIPHRLSGCRLCRALPRRWSSASSAPRRSARRASPASPRRWRAITSSCSPTRTSTRWRGSIPTAASARRWSGISKATTSSNSTSPRRCSTRATPTTASRSRRPTGPG